jgi:hypothetical protein
MALPPHLAKFDGLIDLIVEQIVKEIERGAENKRAADREPADFDFSVNDDPPLK